MVVVVLTVVAKNVSLRFRVTSITYYRNITISILASKGEYLSKVYKTHAPDNFQSGFFTT